MDDLRISIAMCTHEGERHLPEQLESIAGQTALPDELVVCDDASTDRSAALLREFGAAAPFPVFVHVNRDRLGSTKNFEQAINLCSGEVILLADQDDVWVPEKTKVMAAAFADAPDAGVVFADADVIDEQSRPLGVRLWDAVGFHEARRRRFSAGERVEVLLESDAVTGATMGFRARFKDLLLPIPPEWVHDAWIALVIAAVAKVGVVPQPLIQYRRHPAQQIGLPPARLLDRLRMRLRRLDARHFLTQVARYQAVEQRLRERAEWSPYRSQLSESLEPRLKHLKARADMRTGNNRLRLIAGELVSGRYHRYSSGLSSVAKDLLPRP